MPHCTDTGPGLAACVDHVAETVLTAGLVVMAVAAALLVVTAAAALAAHR